jgi:hypothetical protein
MLCYISLLTWAFVFEGGGGCDMKGSGPYLHMEQLVKESRLSIGLQSLISISWRLVFLLKSQCYLMQVLSLHLITIKH